MMESSLPAPPGPLHVEGGRLVGVLFGLLRNLEIHRDNNELLHRLNDEVLGATRSFAAAVGEPFTMRMFGEELFVCNRLLRLDDSGFERAGKLASLLVRSGIGALLLGNDLTGEDLQCFCGDLKRALAGEPEALERGKYGDLLFARLEEDPGRSLSARPEQLGIWLFATLLDLTEVLDGAAEAGRRPSLLPIKRVLQRMSDAARRHMAIFQMLLVVRDFSRELSRPRRAVCEAMASLGFGISLGLGRSDLLAGALAALLGRLGEGRPSATAEVLSYRGLGELAPEVVLAVQDSRAPGTTPGLLGQVLSLVRAYEDALVPGPGAVAPSVIVARLAAEPPRGVDRELAALFGQWRGADPLGSPVQLADGRLGLVFGPSEHSSAFPSVLPMSPEGTVGAELDLGAPGAVGVAERPSPASLGLDLTRVRAGRPAQPHG